jgi:Zn-dependent membrane protease YugP
MSWWFNLYMLSNPYYLIGTIFVIIAAIIAIYAQFKVQSTYARYKRVHNRRGMTGAMVAREILDANGMSNVPVNRVSGELTDHFNPGNMTINLSNDIYAGTSIAAMAVAAHECGHAIQHHTGYKPIRFRNAIVPFANVGNYVGWFAFFAGLILGYTKLAWFGFILMCGILVFQIVTLPVEIDASKRGLAILSSQYLAPDEYRGAKKMLQAAALTYVAAVLQVLASMLRLALVLIGNSRDN